MARMRQLKPGFFTDPELAEFPIHARVLFEGLWCHADRRGRLREQPRFLKNQILPWDDVDVDELLGMLAKPRGKKPGHIVRYEVDGEKYIWIPKFLKHQRPHPKEPDSEIPPAPGEDPANHDSGDPESRPRQIQISLDPSFPSSSSSPSSASGSSGSSEDPPIAPRTAGGQPGNLLRLPKVRKRPNRKLTLVEEKQFLHDELVIERAKLLDVWLRDHPGEGRDAQLEWVQGRFVVGPPDAAEVVDYAQYANDHVRRSPS